MVGEDDMVVVVVVVDVVVGEVVLVALSPEEVDPQADVSRAKAPAATTLTTLLRAMASMVRAFHPSYAGREGRKSTLPARPGPDHGSLRHPCDLRLCPRRPGGG